MAEANTDADILSILHYSISHLYFELSMWDQSIVHARKSVQYARRAGFQNIEYISLDLLISNFDDEPDSLAHYQKLAEAVKKNLDDPYTNYLSYVTQGELFSIQENYDSAGICFQQALKIVTLNNDRYWIGFVLAKLALNEYLKENYSKAQEYFSERKEYLDEWRTLGGVLEISRSPCRKRVRKL